VIQANKQFTCDAMGEARNRGKMGGEEVKVLRISFLFPKIFQFDLFFLSFKYHLIKKMA